MQNATLKHIAGIMPGYPFRGRLAESDQGDSLALQMRDTREDAPINWSQVARTNLEGRREPDWLRKGDIVFVARGSNNYSTLIEDVPDKVVITPQFFLVRVTSDKVLPSFLAWQMNQEPARRYFQAASQGSAQPSIRKSVLAELPLALPPLDEQEKIMEMVDCLKAQQDTFRALEQNQKRLMAAIANQVFNKTT